MSRIFRVQKKRYLSILAFTLVGMLFVSMFFQFGLFSSSNNYVNADTELDRLGWINVNTSANVRALPSTTSSVITSLPRGHIVQVVASVKGEYLNTYASDIWYKLNYFDQAGNPKIGFIHSALVELYPEGTNEEFELALDEQGFPESYRVYLRALNKVYPQWVFRALHTNLDWSNVINNQNVAGRSLLWYGINENWRSTDSFAYSWATNKWIYFHNTNWYAASRSTIEFYMDPRNFLSPIRIFQFESLSYDEEESVYSQQGVEKILNNSFMANTSFTYTNESTDQPASMMFSEAFMKAAKASEVSPYHLASRSKLEVSSGLSPSPSVTGTFSQDLINYLISKNIPYSDDDITTDYDGHFNFYNIGAFDSTGPLEAVMYGLQFAKLGPGRKIEQTSTDDRLLIPWNDRLKSIVGGAKYIGSSYINVGQNTLYTQKFDVDNSDGELFWHQYMTNVQAPYQESRDLHEAYDSMGMLDEPKLFIIPVYKNMPSLPCPAPLNSGNPNNWLKSMKVNQKDVTPNFMPDTASGYSFVVENNVASAVIDVVPVSDKASVQRSRKVNLNVGNNNIDIEVVSENGNKRVYKLNIVRRDNGSITPSPTPIVTPSPTGSPTPVPTETPSPPPAEIASDTYLIEENKITGIDISGENNRADNILANLTCDPKYSITLHNPDGSVCSDVVGSGVTANIGKDGQTLKIYEIIIYGDVNGDGKINTIDLTAALRYIQGRMELSNASIAASDSNGDGKVNTIDLTLTLRHIQQKMTIAQKR